MVEYLGEPKRETDITFLAKIPKLNGPVVRFHIEARGIGDAVCALYAACGLSNAGHQIEFHTRHLQWLAGVKHPNLAIIASDHRPFDASCNYRDQLYAFKRGELRSRPDWYIANICQAYGIEPCDPARPEQAPTFKRGRYVLLAPFSSHDSRDWGFSHFRRLAKMLQAQGIRVVVTGTKEQEQRLYETFYGMTVERHIGRTAQEVVSIIGSAAVVVSNDSGIAHLGGLYGAPTICLMAQYDYNYTFICADTVEPITSDMSCVGCHTIVEFGWDQGCNQGCSALQTINPDRVFNRVLELYETA